MRLPALMVLASLLILTGCPDPDPEPAPPPGVVDTLPPPPVLDAPPPPVVDTIPQDTVAVDTLPAPRP
jgi:hypothetical protein